MAASAKRQGPRRTRLVSLRSGLRLLNLCSRMAAWKTEGLRNAERTSTLQGTISRITYQHPDTHYTVARIEIDGASGVTVVGVIFPVSEGEEIKVTGFWKTHPRYGLQFQVDHWEKIDPATIEGIEKYLGSGLIKGIGPTYAKRLVSAFGLDTLRVLSEAAAAYFRGRRHRRGPRAADHASMARAARYAGCDGVSPGPWSRRVDGA